MKHSNKKLIVATLCIFSLILGSLCFFMSRTVFLKNKKKALTKELEYLVDNTCFSGEICTIFLEILCGKNLLSSKFIDCFTIDTNIVLVDKTDIKNHYWTKFDHYKIDTSYSRSYDEIFMLKELPLFFLIKDGKLFDYRFFCEYREFATQYITWGGVNNTPFSDTIIWNNNSFLDEDMRSENVGVGLRKEIDELKKEIEFYKKRKREVNTICGVFLELLKLKTLSKKQLIDLWASEHKTIDWEALQGNKSLLENINESDDIYWETLNENNLDTTYTNQYDELMKLKSFSLFFIIKNGIGIDYRIGDESRILGESYMSAAVSHFGAFNTPN